MIVCGLGFFWIEYDHTQFEKQYEFRTNTVKVGLEINLF